MKKQEKIIDEMKKQKTIVSELNTEQVVIKKNSEKLLKENTRLINNIVRDSQNMLSLVNLSSKHPAYKRFISRNSNRFVDDPKPWKEIIASELWFSYSRDEETTISFVFTERDLKEYTHILRGLRKLASYLGLYLKKKKKVDKYCYFLTFYSKNK